MPTKATKSKKKGIKPIKRSQAKAKPVVPKTEVIKSQTLKPYVSSVFLKEKICAITDPFCDHARGAKWSDGNNFATVPYSNRAHIAFPTFSNGGTIVHFTPVNVPSCYIAPTAWSGADYVLTAQYNSVTGPTVLNNTFDGFRVVTAGLVIRSLATVMNTSGYLIISRLAVMPAPGASISPGGMLNPQVTTHPIVPGMEVPVIFRPLGADSRNFVGFPPNGTNPILDPAWDVIKIEVIGAAATSVVIDVEVFFNYEMQLDPNSVLAATFSKAAPSNPVLTNAASRIADATASRAHSTVEKLTNYVEEKAISFMKEKSAMMLGALLGV